MVMLYPHCFQICYRICHGEKPRVITDLNVTLYDTEERKKISARMNINIYLDNAMLTDILKQVDKT
jgi:hypothetical protein